MNALKHMKILYVNDRNSDEEYGVSELKDYCNNIIISNNSINAIEVYKEEKPEIVIYSISFPKIKEEEFIKQIKSINKDAQVIITTEHIDKKKLYNAINFHLIKYLAYPFNMNSLLDSLNECIKSIDSHTSNIIKLSDSLTYDKFNRTLLKNNELISLSEKETNFFDILVKKRDRAISYEEFNQIIWHGEMTKDALRSIVKDLRKKIDKTIIKNVSGIGYRLDI
ncbi:winged helix-turn-helix domain-containing protein [Arcobacter sp. CECT 8985]|uniref:winged helix-turn-helix domain-containing protein n=1 Tax=Arcobacter sp. CECT 8985 TaxID=1935424 RepID=UPI00100B9B59|nr:winged helix-turn-helix domain-containing protein [Arcobacter sp. CECT 8985]RXJ83876.1 hypothetical protein CRU93_13240 [Arcobacter sp. CECT 8985]